MDLRVLRREFREKQFLSKGGCLSQSNGKDRGLPLQAGKVRGLEGPAMISEGLAPGGKRVLWQGAL